MKTSCANPALPHAPTCGARLLTALIALTFALALLFGAGFLGCSQANQAEGAAFSSATSITPAAFDAHAATGDASASIDASQTSSGFVGACATSDAHLKFQITQGDHSANYDLPNDGTPIVCPLTFGNGTYTFRIMLNTQGNNYVELYSATADVSLESEFAPFIRPNVYCDFNEESACVEKARELVANATNEAEALEAICTWIVDTISYDDAKASQLKSATGYVPNPDETLASGTGVCFDYASLGAAMLRSQGIPTKIVTGYVSPGDIYHAWIMVYIDGTWKSAQFSVDSNTWSRIDLTFAASGGGENVGNGESYTDRFVY